MNDEHKLWLSDCSTDPNEWLKLKYTMEIGGLVAERLNGEVSLAPARAHLITFPGDITEFWKSEATRVRNIMSST